MPPHPKYKELLRQDPRYPHDAYDFVFQALDYTQKHLRAGADHVSGYELLEGIRELALREFGLLSRTVFRFWGINRTDDIGEIVFNLIEVGLMSKREGDSRSDFHQVYDLDKALTENYRIKMPQV